MLAHPNIDPVMLHAGPVTIRWYAMMYILGFAAAYFVIERRVKETGINFKPTDSGDLIAQLIFGLLIGARLGFCLFYKPAYYLADPAKVFALWEGGMSFHGGFLGVMLVAVLFCRKRNIGFLELCDMVAPAAPIGLALGRLGNFINGELWGRPTDLPWGMLFQLDPTHQPRHPSQLYELFTEGILLAAVLWGVRNKRLPHGTMLGIFIGGYGIARIFCELFREPDAELVLGVIPRGMFLSMPMVLVGAALVWWAKTRQPSSPHRGEVAEPEGDPSAQRGVLLRPAGTSPEAGEGA